MKEQLNMLTPTVLCTAKVERLPLTLIGYVLRLSFFLKLGLAFFNSVRSCDRARANYTLALSTLLLPFTESAARAWTGGKIRDP